MPTKVEDYHLMGAEELARKLDRAENTLDSAQRTAAMIRYEVAKRMTAMKTDDNEYPMTLHIKGTRQFRATTKIVWDNSLFSGLKELIDPARWKQVWTPAYQETKEIPGKMDTAKLLVMARHEGGELQKAVRAIHRREYGKIKIEDTKNSN